MVVLENPLRLDGKSEMSKISDFHNTMRDKLPFLTPDHYAGVSFEANAMSGATRNHQTEVKARYNFSSPEDNLIVSEEFIGFATNNYVSWDRFFGTFDRACRSLQSFFPEAGRFKRVGLRYKDAIERSVIGVGDVEWNQLIRSELFPSLDLNVVGYEGFRSTLYFAKDMDFLTANYGVVKNTETSETAFLIDGDFVHDNGTVGFDYGSASDKLQLFNRYARNFFRWSVTEQLHQALRPSPIQPPN